MQGQGQRQEEDGDEHQDGGDQETRGLPVPQPHHRHGEGGREDDEGREAAGHGDVHHSQPGRGGGGRGVSHLVRDTPSTNPRQGWQEIFSVLLQADIKTRPPQPGPGGGQHCLVVRPGGLSDGPRSPRHDENPVLDNLHQSITSFCLVQPRRHGLALDLCELPRV